MKMYSEDEKALRKMRRGIRRKQRKIQLELSRLDFTGVSKSPFIRDILHTALESELDDLERQDHTITQQIRRMVEDLCMPMILRAKTDDVRKATTHWMRVFKKRRKRARKKAGEKRQRWVKANKVIYRCMNGEVWDADEIARRVFTEVGYLEDTRFMESSRPCGDWKYIFVFHPDLLAKIFAMVRAHKRQVRNEAKAAKGPPSSTDLNVNTEVNETSVHEV